MTTRRPSDDLFEDSRMTFGEHLEELRTALVRSLIGIAIGCLIGFFVADKLVDFLQRPLFDALRDFNLSRANAAYMEQHGFHSPEIEHKMQREHLAPQTVFVDPGQLVEAIRTISPQSLAEINLEPYRFTASHVTKDNVADIAAALIDPLAIDSPHPAKLQQLAAMVSEDQRSTLQKIATDPPVSSQHQSQLLDILNALIDQPQIHQHEAFASFMTKPAWSLWQLFSEAPANSLEPMKRQVDLHGDAQLTRRLNRLLVARTFENLIEPPTIALTPIEIWQFTVVSTQSLSPHEPFVTWIKAAIITGLVLSAPWVFYQLWLFVAAGLYPHEKKYVHYYLPISIALFVFGVCLAFFFVFKPVLTFLFTFNASMGINPQVRIGEWLSFVMFLPLGFGIAFQLPLVMLFLNRIGIFSVEAYTSKWRIAVMIISVLSMILTPADPVSMIMLGVPLTALYFFGIGLCRWMPRPSNPFGDVAEQI